MKNSLWCAYDTDGVVLIFRESVYGYINNQPQSLKIIKWFELKNSYQRGLENNFDLQINGLRFELWCYICKNVCIRNPPHIVV